MDLMLETLRLPGVILREVKTEKRGCIYSGNGEGEEGALVVWCGVGGEEIHAGWVGHGSVGGAWECGW